MPKKAKSNVIPFPQRQGTVDVVLPESVPQHALGSVVMSGSLPHFDISDGDVLLIRTDVPRGQITHRDLCAVRVQPTNCMIFRCVKFSKAKAILSESPLFSQPETYQAEEIEIVGVVFSFQRSLAAA
jgi:SOS-response transcriptional repressor LexA